MRKIILASLLAATSVVAVPAQAAVTIYTNKIAFLAAATAVVTETFSNATLVAGLSFTSTVGSISGGVFNDQLVTGSQSTTFSFAGGTTAFGGNFDLTPGGPGIGIAITLVPGGMISQEIPDSASGGFFGLISTTAFNSVVLTGGTQPGAAETYNLDNLVFATPQSAVPEPATWGLMLVGFGMMGGALRSNRKAAVRFR